MWQIGEFERNFMIMQTSSGTGENIMGDRCMLDDRGGWGSFNNWEGVWPKWRIWSSTAFFITGSWENKTRNLWVIEWVILMTTITIRFGNMTIAKQSKILLHLPVKAISNLHCPHRWGSRKRWLHGRPRDLEKAKWILQIRWNGRAWKDCNSDRARQYPFTKPWVKRPRKTVSLAKKEQEYATFLRLLKDTPRSH